MSQERLLEIQRSIRRGTRGPDQRTVEIELIAPVGRKHLDPLRTVQEIEDLRILSCVARKRIAQLKRKGRLLREP